MLRIFLMTLCILAGTLEARAQAPGIDPRGLATGGAPIVIGVVEGTHIVVWPDKMPKAGPVIRQPNGTYIAELPHMKLDYMVGYIYRVRVQEVIKADHRVRLNDRIEIFSAHQLEGGVSLPQNQRVLLILTRFEPKKETFTGSSVRNIGEITRRGVPFNLRARYYSVAGDANGVVLMTDLNQRLIEEIRATVRRPL
jgi:hypothetical protein